LGVEFDPINKYILITSPTTELSALEIYSAAMDWCDDQPIMGYTVPMRAVGKFDMGGGVFSDSIFLLINGWKIKFWSGTYQAIITGTLLGEPGQQRTIPPDSGNVEVVFQVSSQGTIIPDEAEWTQTEKNGVITDVNTIQAKTVNLPGDPASEINVTTVGQALNVHDKEVKGNPGWQPDDTLREIKQVIDDVKAMQQQIPEPEEEKPKSIAQYLNWKRKNH